MNIVAEDGATPFAPNEQVQPASIDLRLSGVFWKPLKRSTLDFRRSFLLEVSPRRYYQKLAILPEETIVLKPNELLLGRTLEEFSIPNGYAAELIGRSSFARLGLMVHSTGGFINPGWRGHMPLQLLNLGPNSIRLVPGLLMCQVRIVKLTGLAQHPYGDQALQSVYIDDDGGPSYWWRDKRIINLHKLLAQRCVEERIQKILYDAIGSREAEVIERLEKFIESNPVAEIGNAESLLDAFAGNEDKLRARKRFLLNLRKICPGISVAISLFALKYLPLIEWWQILIWTAALLIMIFGITAFGIEVGEYFGSAERNSSRRS